MLFKSYVENWHKDCEEIWGKYKEDLYALDTNGGFLSFKFNKISLVEDIFYHIL